MMIQLPDGSWADDQDPFIQAMMSGGQPQAEQQFPPADWQAQHLAVPAAPVAPWEQPVAQAPAPAEAPAMGPEPVNMFQPDLGAQQLERPGVGMSPDGSVLQPDPIEVALGRQQEPEAPQVEQTRQDPVEYAQQAVASPEATMAVEGAKAADKQLEAGESVAQQKYAESLGWGAKGDAMLQSAQEAVDITAQLKKDLGEYDKLQLQAQQNVKPVQNAWADKSLGQKAAGIISAMIGGFYAPYHGGENKALEMLMDMAAQDEARQRGNNEQQMSLARTYGEASDRLRLRGESYLKHQDAAITSRLASLDAMAQQQIGALKSEQAKAEAGAQYHQLRAGLAEKLAERRDKYQEYALAARRQGLAEVTAQQKARGAGGGGVSSKEAKEQAANTIRNGRLFKEIKNPDGTVTRQPYVAVDDKQRLEVQGKLTKTDRYLNSLEKYDAMVEDFADSIDPDALGVNFTLTPEQIKKYKELRAQQISVIRSTGENVTRGSETDTQMFFDQIGGKVGDKVTINDVRTLRDILARERQNTLDGTKIDLQWIDEGLVYEPVTMSPKERALYQPHKQARDKAKAALKSASDRVDIVGSIFQAPKNPDGSLAPGKPFDKDRAKSALVDAYKELEKNPDRKLGRRMVDYVKQLEQRGVNTNLGTNSKPIDAEAFFLNMATSLPPGELAKNQQAASDKRGQKQIDRVLSAPKQ